MWSHQNTEAHWSTGKLFLGVHEQWLWFVVKAQKPVFVFNHEDAKKVQIQNSANDRFSSPNHTLELKWVEILGKTNGQNPQKQLLITNPVVVHRINWLYFLSLIPFEAGISIFSFALVIDFSTPNKERNPNVTP